MCGRYTLTQAEKALGRLIPLEEWKQIWEGRWQRFNVAPTQQMPIVFSREGRRVPAIMRWGFVPFYERDKPKPQAMINARSETIVSKAAFKRAAQKQRCLVPADGFFEWKRDGKDKTPYYFTLRGDEPFAFAALWEPATATLPAGFLLLTTGPNELMAPIHDRMPVIVQTERYDEWLSNEPLDADGFAQLCSAYPASEMAARPISSLVNSPKNDGPEILALPAEMPPKFSREDLTGQGELF
jgi:putative SOS response-associated peptidase YedK